ncbi:MAG: hypothetical protein AAB110_01510, partial [Candidatus Desantisbacteria bacterium]
MNRVLKTQSCKRRTRFSVISFNRLKTSFMMMFLYCFIPFFAQQVYAKDVPFPEPAGYVNDFADIISEDYRTKLNQIITELHQKAQGAEVS